MIWYILNVLTIPQARDIGGKLAGNILNVLGMYQVGTCLALCPFPYNVLMMYQPGTLVLAPSGTGYPRILPQGSALQVSDSPAPQKQIQHLE